MNNVAGIDVSKGKSMVSVLRPFGEVVAKPFSVGHTGSELKELADYLKSLDGETRVVMEHTGRYYEPVARFLHEEGIFVSAVNPKLIKDFLGGGGASVYYFMIQENSSAFKQGGPPV